MSHLNIWVIVQIDFNQLWPRSLLAVNPGTSLFVVTQQLCNVTTGSKCLGQTKYLHPGLV